jgi:hypothetical protein
MAVVFLKKFEERILHYVQDDELRKDPSLRSG